MRVYFNDDYTASAYAFDTTRKSAAVAKLIYEGAVPNVSIDDPKDSYDQTEWLIRKLHGVQYAEAVKTGTPKHLAESQGFTWDPKVYTMALAHNAGVVAAVNHSFATGEVSGTLSSGLHHARYGHGAGFCTFNGLAAGVLAARQKGCENVLVIDFDAHGGGGTYSLCQGEMTQVDVVVSRFDTYDIDPWDLRSYIRVTFGQQYCDEIAFALDAVAPYEFDFIIYNAGMDPFNAGISANDLLWREETVAQWIAERNVPAVFTLAGGYTWGGVTQDEITDLHLMTVEEFAKIGASVA